MKLFIIGNGFDLAHEYKTSYAHFRDYLRKNQISSGSFYIPDIFNDASEDDWNDFEKLLGNYEFVEWGGSYSANIHVKEDKEQDRNMSYNNRLNDSYEEIARNLPSILKSSLCNFIEEVTSSQKKMRTEVKGLLAKQDLFVTFNYSLLLEGIYNIEKEKILHIHRTFHAEENIIFGHNLTNLKRNSNLPEFDLSTPENRLTNLNAEFIKDYQLNMLETFLKNKNVSRIIIMGHGLGEIDERYFSRLNLLFSNVKNVIYFFHYNKNEKDYLGRFKTIDVQRAEKQLRLEQLFPKKQITIKEW